MITSLGYGTYFFFATLMVLMGFWAWYFVPETKGKSLEEMEALFGAPTAFDFESGKALPDEKKKDIVHIENA